jgi:hypothetical protein
MPLVCQPSTVTTIAPELAPTGMGNDKLVLAQAEGVAVSPLKVTVELVPWASPKLVPVTVMVPPIGACAGDTAVITGITRNDLALLAVPPEVTITSANPGRSTPGTGATIFVSDYEVGVAATPPMVTVFPMADAPKPKPLIVRAEPTGLTGPTVGEIVEIAGAANAKVPHKRPRINRTALRNRKFLAMVVTILRMSGLPSLFISWAQIFCCRLAESICKNVALQEVFSSSAYNSLVIHFY